MGGYGNSGAKVSKMHTVGGRVVTCDIFLIWGQPYVTVCNKGGMVKFGPKKCDIFFEWPLNENRVTVMTAAELCNAIATFG